jgi:excisionase family DNA binding protein
VSLQARAPRVITSPYLTTAEAVTYLRLSSASSLYYLIREQRLPYARRGGRYLFDPQKLDQWLDPVKDV